jgi:hypothetical protein
MGEIAAECRTGCDLIVPHKAAGDVMRLVYDTVAADKVGQSRQQRPGKRAARLVDDGQIREIEHPAQILRSDAQPAGHPTPTEPCRDRTPTNPPVPSEECRTPELRRPDRYCSHGERLCYASGGGLAMTCKSAIIVAAFVAAVPTVVGIGSASATTQVPFTITRCSGVASDKAPRRPRGCVASCLVISAARARRERWLGR